MAYRTGLPHKQDYIITRLTPNVRHGPTNSDSQSINTGMQEGRERVVFSYEEVMKELLVSSYELLISRCLVLKYNCLV